MDINLYIKKSRNITGGIVICKRFQCFIAFDIINLKFVNPEIIDLLCQTIKLALNVFIYESSVLLTKYLLT